MRFALLTLSLIFACFSHGQHSYTDSLTTIRQEHDSTFLKSVLNDAEREHISNLCYFNPDENYIVEAKFKRIRGKKFAMPMTNARNKIVYYRKYGKVTFTLNGAVCELFVYENIDLKKKDGFEDYLFLPFRDATSGDLTYGGGRFIDLEKTTNGIITIDFNTCYNPYCAYSERYSCPIVPKENKLGIAIKAGSCYRKHD